MDTEERLARKNEEISRFSNSHVAETFERNFLQRSLETQIRNCDQHKLCSRFRRWLPKRQPILEAGCGSGRWVAWFQKNGWKSTGLDWSETLCERARKLIPDARFVAGDMKCMPFEEAEFGSVVSLGAVEHTSEGPGKSLAEIARVLRPDGIAIISVPFAGSIRRMTQQVHQTFLKMKAHPLLRKIFNKPPITGQTRSQARRGVVSTWMADFSFRKDGWFFYEYRFNKSQMRQFVQSEGFEILEEFVSSHDEGVLHNFGGLAGKYDHETATVKFSLLGRWLRNILPIDMVGHMLVYVLHKPFTLKKEEPQITEISSC